MRNYELKTSSDLLIGYLLAVVVVATVIALALIVAR